MRTRRDGIALIMVLWVMVLLGVIAMSFSFSTRRSSASTRNMKQDTQAYYLALSAHQEVLSHIAGDRALNIDYLDEEGRLRLDAERPPVSGTRETDDGQVIIRLLDEDSRLNINSLNPETVMRLLAYSGVPDDERQGMADSLADWIDRDDLHHLSGAEDEYYETLGYKTRNMPLSTPEELLLVKGFKPGYLKGDGEDLIAMLPMLTVYGAGLNVYTAADDVLRIAGLSKQDIDVIKVHRETILQNAQAVPVAARFGKTFTNNFRIEVLARAKHSPVGVKIETVIRRAMGPEGVVLKTLYWSEDVYRWKEEEVEDSGA